DKVDRTKEIAIRNEANIEKVFEAHIQKHQKTCKTNLSDYSNNRCNCQIKQKILEVKRQ
uniref:Conjugal transfer protein TraN n=1 Tax=Loa loa TaxID=7209 RepID=A0A1I7VWS2_LOALO